MRRLLLVITLVVFMCACEEKFETYYSSATAAAKAGEFDRGWLPDLLKPDVMDIRLWYDIDSNEVRGRFALNERVVRSLGSRCEPGNECAAQIFVHARVVSSLNHKWWFSRAW